MPAYAALPPPANVTLDQEIPSSMASGGELSGNIPMTFFPSQDPFTPLLADPRQPTTHIGFFAHSNGKYGQFEGDVGGDFGIVRWESPIEGINKAFQIGLMGTSFSRFAFVGASTFLEDADYVVGLPLTFRYHAYSGRLFFYHESSHTGFSFTQLTGLSKASDFGQEILQYVNSWDVTPYFRVYGGSSYRVVGFSYYPTFGDSLILLSGLEWYSRRIRSTPGRVYLAFNLESRGINGYALDEDFQMGFIFHQPHSYFQIRPAIELFNGYSPMGDLLFEKEDYVSIGVSFDF